MRVVIYALVVLVALGLLGFAITNSAERVSVTIFNVQYSNVHLFYVVLSAFVAGAAFSGVIGLIEGTSDRLARRRLQKDVVKLETELSGLRSQLAAEDEPLPAPSSSSTTTTKSVPDPPVASAPVHDADSSDPYTAGG